MKPIRSLLLLTAAALLAACGSTANPGSESDKQLTHTRATAALADMENTDPSLKTLLSKAHAYAIFPKIISGAVGVGGAAGDGEVYESGKLIGYADLHQGSIGLQLGGQAFSELIVFESEGPLADLKNGDWDFDASASAVAASKGAGDKANYTHGVVVFYQPQSGLMASAAIGVQKLRYKPVGN